MGDICQFCGQPHAPQGELICSEVFTQITKKEHAALRARVAELEAAILEWDEMEGDDAPLERLESIAQALRGEVSNG